MRVDSGESNRWEIHDLGDCRNDNRELRQYVAKRIINCQTIETVEMNVFKNIKRL